MYAHTSHGPVLSICPCCVLCGSLSFLPQVFADALLCIYGFRHASALKHLLTVYLPDCSVDSSAIHLRELFISFFEYFSKLMGPVSLSIHLLFFFSEDGKKKKK